MGYHSAVYLTSGMEECILISHDVDGNLATIPFHVANVISLGGSSTSWDDVDARVLENGIIGGIWAHDSVIGV